MSCEKLCVFCNHLKCEYDGGSNCETCGYDQYADMECGKDLWKNKPYVMGEDFLHDFRDVILQAKTCPEFEAAK